MKIILSFIIFCISFYSDQTKGIGSIREDRIYSENWTTHKTSQFSISFPESWIIDTSKAMGIDLFVFSTPDSLGDKFRENVNVLSTDFAGSKILLDSFVIVSEKQIKTMANDLEIIESKRYNTPKFDFHKLDFTARQGIFELRFIQYYIVSKGKGYTITATIEKNKFTLYETTMLKILSSFVLEI